MDTPRPANPSSASAPELATIAIRRRVKAGNETAFAEAVRGAAHAASTFAGYSSSDVLKPPGAAGEWQFILRFDSSANLRAWEESAVSQGWQARADGLTDAPRVERVNGLEAWFTLPGQESPPPLWKTAVISALGIYPMVLFVFPRVAPLVAGLAPWLGQFITVVLTTPVITWGVMPLLTRLFRGWLYPADATANRNQTPPGNPHGIHAL